MSFDSSSNCMSSFASYFYTNMISLISHKTIYAHIYSPIRWIVIFDKNGMIVDWLTTHLGMLAILWHSHYRFQCLTGAYNGLDRVKVSLKMKPFISNSLILLLKCLIRYYYLLFELFNKLKIYIRCCFHHMCICIRTYRIWKPDTYFYNGKNAYMHTITVPNKFVRIRTDGKVWYSSRMTVKANCPMRLENFPMDTQNCPLELGSCE